MKNSDKINTIVYDINEDKLDYEILQKAADVIKHGGLVIFPTETVYGIGADALNDRACEKIYYAKGRPSDNPLIVHISHIDELDKLVEPLDEKSKLLTEKFWPGPMTLIMKKKNVIGNRVTAGLDTVAIRMPKNKLASELIRLSNTPIAAPSANLSGKPSPTLGKHVVEDMLGRVDMILVGGSCEYGLESSVIDVTGEVATILRPGNITKEDVESVLGKCEYDPALISLKEELVPKSPGQKYKHYSPIAKVILYKGDLKNQIAKINEDYKKNHDNGYKVGIMTTSENEVEYKQENVIAIGNRDDEKTIASNLFKALRQFDAMKCDVVLSESFGEIGLGKAIMNRLSKASDEIVDCDKIKILFVCTGNTCRSPMAEGIMRCIVEKDNLKAEISSCGVNAFAGNSASSNAVEVLKEEGIDISSHKSKQITKDLIEDADIILTATTSHRDVMLAHFNNEKYKIKTLKEFCGETSNLNIQDPFGGDLETYRRCKDEIKTYLKVLAQKLK